MINWNKVNYADKESCRDLLLALGHVTNAPLKGSKAEYFTQRSNFPAGVYPEIEKMNAGVDADLGWQALFAQRDYTNVQADGFTVSIGTSGAVLQAVVDGDKALTYSAHGVGVHVPFVRYQGAIDQLRHFIADGRYWDLQDSVNGLTNAYYTALANSHYSLFDALGAGNDLAWQAPTPAALANTDPNYVLSRDANTINSAIIDVIGRVGEAVGVNANSTFGILCPLELAQRIRQAVGATINGASAVGFRTVVVPTTYLTSATDYYVCPLGKAGVSGMRQELTYDSQADILANADTISALGRWGAVVNGAAVTRCASA